MKVKMRCPFRGATRFLGIIFLIIVTIACMAMSEAAEINTEVHEPVQKYVEVQQPQVEPEPVYKYNITAKEREMLVRLVFTEANTESLECQKAVVSVVINRWKNGYWGDTLYDVIYAKNQFSAAHKIATVTPTTNNYEAVDYVLKNGCTVPEYVLYFRANYHFKWKGYVPYKAIDHTYFGYIAKDKNN